MAKMDAPALAKFLLTLALMDDLQLPAYSIDKPDQLLAAAKRYGINAERVRATVVADVQATRRTRRTTGPPKSRKTAKGPARKATKGPR